jgi:hydroxymethylpyrimidine/phosphomethylpyrimidine kinase
MTRALTVAGSDPAGGAGLQLDLQVFASRGVSAGAVVTALTVQTHFGVQRVSPVDADLVAQQLEAALGYLQPTVVKLGMLHTAANVLAVTKVLVRHPDVWVLADPVMVSSSGTHLLDEAGVAAFRTLFPRVDLLTPNADEAAVLSQRSVRNALEARDAAQALCGLGARAVLVKGGHLPGPAVDVLFDGVTFNRFEHARLMLRKTHGTGCLLSSLIGAERARGLGLVDAVAAAKNLWWRCMDEGTDDAQGVRRPRLAALRLGPELSGV